MAKVKYINNLYVINNPATRPGWKDELKVWLLEDFLESKWPQRITVAQLINHFQVISNNERGTIEALERRHIVSWHDIIQIYVYFINRDNPQVISKSNWNLIKEPVTEILRIILAEHSKAFFKGLRDIAEGEELAAFYDKNLTHLNSSRNNLFIGPMRRNRQVGANMDRGDDVPAEVLAGRPGEGLVRLMVVLKGSLGTQLEYTVSGL